VTTEEAGVTVDDQRPDTAPGGGTPDGGALPEGGVHGINIVAVRPENHEKVIGALRGMGPIAQVPGLRSMHIYRSIDGARLLNHMQWDSPEAFEAAASIPHVIEAVHKAGEYADTPGDPGFFSLLYTAE
jgi:heme-degrading monooxygenase HmoA